MISADLFAPTYEVGTEPWKDPKTFMATIEGMSTPELLWGIRRLELHGDPEAEHVDDRKGLALYRLLILGELGNHPDWQREVGWTGASCGLAGCDL